MRPDEILQTLERAGFEARYVGGCVRDTLLGRPVHDWDIASQALPEQAMPVIELSRSFEQDYIRGLFTLAKKMEETT